MAAFTAGNIVVYRVGGTATDGPGAAALAATATAVFLDEYTPAGAYVQTIALPTTASTTNGVTNDALTDGGLSTSDGQITESGNGTSILVAGYNAAVGSATPGGQSNTTDPRVVGIVSATGTVDTSTVLTGYGGSNNFRSAASADGSSIYLGSAVGVGQTTADSTATPTNLNTVNTEQVQTVNNTLYYSTQKGTTGIYSLGTLPAAAGTGSLVAASPAPYGFFFTTLGSGTAPDTLYVADGTNGIEKFSLSGTTYSATGAVAAPSGVTFTGITGTVANGQTTLYASAASGVYKLTDASGAGGTLTGTLTTPFITPPANTAFRGDALAPTVCYVSGTRIRTVHGDVAVECLAVGDLVVTSSGAHRPIRWLGHRTVDCRRHHRPEIVMPVRITADAFGENRPARDLLVSPGHALCVDVLGEVLIMAASLVNGSTVTQNDVETVTYWHVELDSHDILLAENLPAESYLEMGNRSFFAESGVIQFAGSPDVEGATHSDFCRPFHMDGPLVEAVRAQLAARARTLGWRLEDQGLGDLHLVVDGVRVEPLVRGFVARFPVPADARDVWLISSSGIAAQSSGSPDQRRLGLCLRGLAVIDGFGASRAVAVDDLRLCVGFHAVEVDADGSSYRWTGGRARLPANLWQDTKDGFFLRVETAGPVLPRWITSADAARGDPSIALAG